MGHDLVSSSHWSQLSGVFFSFQMFSFQLNRGDELCFTCFRQSRIPQIPGQAKTQGCGSAGLTWWAWLHREVVDCSEKILVLLRSVWRTNPSKFRQKEPPGGSGIRGRTEAGSLEDEGQWHGRHRWPANWRVKGWNTRGRSGATWWPPGTRPRPLETAVQSHCWQTAAVVRRFIQGDEHMWVYSSRRIENQHCYSK